MSNVSQIVFGAIIGGLVLSSAIVNGLVAVRTNDAVAAPRSHTTTVIQMPVAEPIVAAKPAASSSSATVKPAASSASSDEPVKHKAKRKKRKAKKVRIVRFHICSCSL